MFVALCSIISRPLSISAGMGQGEEGIAFEDDNGDVQLVSTDALAGFFALFADKVKCVVLNACYSEVQATAIAEHIPYVIGMKKAIGDTAAIEFAVAFYDALGAGETIEFAFTLACNAVQWAGIPEHLTPILKSQSRSSPIAQTRFVTNHEYLEFVRNAGHHRPPHLNPSTPTRSDGRGDVPVTGVSWDDAVAYCDWMNGCLPSKDDGDLSIGKTLTKEFCFKEITECRSIWNPQSER